MSRLDSWPKGASTALLTLGLGFWMMAERSGAQVPATQPPQPSTNGAGTTAGQPPNIHFPDPNMPTVVSPPGLKIVWHYTQDLTLPIIGFRDPATRVAGPTYLGWNADGSWFINEDSKIYAWKLQENSLTVRYQNAYEIPEEVLASLKNPHFDTQALLARYKSHAKSPAAPPH